MTTIEALEAMRSRVHACLMEARLNKKELFEILDETMDGISDDFYLIYYGPPKKDKT